MNLVEIWISNITNEEELENGLVRVTATYDSWGVEETEARIFQKEYWEQIKKQGYYLG